MTSTPEFTPDPHTQPFLLDATAYPNPSSILVVDLANPPTPITFSAHVVSQDDLTPPFNEVRPRGFIDLGAGTAGQTPWFGSFLPASALVQPGTIDEMGRVASVTWHPAASGPNTPTLGCHTATLVAAHTYDDLSSCPCAGDFSQITWQVLLCNADLMPDSCNIDTLTSCPVQNALTNSCAMYERSIEAATDCPAGATGITP